MIRSRPMPRPRRTCGPRVPGDVVAALAPFLVEIAEDVPTDELERPPFRYDMRSIEQWYRELDRAGGEHDLMVARDRDGSPVDCTEVIWMRRTPHLLYQHQIEAAAADRARNEPAGGLPARAVLVGDPAR
jgi:hypothetical protein